MYVCICHAVTDHAIRDAIAAGARTLDQLSMATGCGGTCGSCREQAQELLDEAIAARGIDPDIARPDV